MTALMRTVRYSQSGIKVFHYIFITTWMLLSISAHSQTDYKNLSQKTLSNGDIQNYILRMEAANDCLYLDSNVIRSFGVNPKIIYSDIRSLPLLATIKFPIDVLRIKISSVTELQQSIDLQSLKNLPSIRAVFILCEAEISSDILKATIKNAPGDVAIISLTSKLN